MKKKLYFCSVIQRIGATLSGVCDPEREWHWVRGFPSLRVGESKL